MKNAARYLLCLPYIVIGWPLAMLIRLLWGESTMMVDGVLVVRLRENSWPTRSWFKGWGGITYGRAIMISPHEEAVLPHEMQHVQQDEAIGFAGLVVGNVLAFACWQPWWGLLVWAAGPILVWVGGCLVSWLRGGSAYRDNFLERAARDASGI